MPQYHFFKIYISKSENFLQKLQKHALYAIKNIF